jgi:hypothetical protein
MLELKARPGTTIAGLRVPTLAHRHGRRAAGFREPIINQQKRDDSWLFDTHVRRPRYAPLAVHDLAGSEHGPRRRYAFNYAVVDDVTNSISVYGLPVEE